MKANKYLAAAALMIGVSAPTMAQNVQNDIDQIAKVIKDNRANLSAEPAKSQIKDWYKLHKKDAQALAGLGQAFFDIKDTANARKYAEEAIKRDTHCGNGYILLGDIQALASTDGGDAAMWYQNAKTMDPKNPKGYTRYASVYRGRSPKEAVESLEELRAVLPDYPVEADAAHIYYNSGNFKEALNYFNKVKDPSKLEKGQLFEYTGAAYFAGDFNKSLQVAIDGLKRFPNEPNFNRMAFYNNLVNKNYTEAEKYAKDLLANSPDSVISEMDLLNLGHVYNGEKNYTEAIKWYQKSLAKKEDNKVRQFIYNAYSELGDVDNAVKVYKEYVDKNPQASNNDYSELAGIYTTAANKTEDAAKKAEYFKKADAVYAEYIQKFPEVADYGTYMRAKINENLDPTYTKGTAKPFYEDLIKKVASHATKGANDDAYLKQAYYYMGAYYYTAGDKTNGDIYWNKLLEIDPENATAKQALGK